MVPTSRSTLGPFVGAIGAAKAEPDPWLGASRRQTVVVALYEARMAQEVANFLLASSGYDIWDCAQLVWLKLA